MSQSPYTKRQQFIALITTAGAMLFFAITTVLLPPAIKRIAADLVLEIPQLTRVITTQFIAFFFAALLAGALSDRWGKLLMLRYSTMLIILGTAL
jgi:MFS family permease